MNRRGEFEIGVTKIFILLGLVAAIWAGYAYAMALKNQSDLQNRMVTIILSHRDGFGDASVHPDVDSDLKQNPQIIYDTKSILIEPTGAGKNGRIKFPYDYRIAVPILGKNWDIHFEVDVEEKLQRTMY